MKLVIALHRQENLYLLLREDGNYDWFSILPKSTKNILWTHDGNSYFDLDDWLQDTTIAKRLLTIVTIDYDDYGNLYDDYPELFI